MNSRIETASRAPVPGASRVGPKLVLGIFLVLLAAAPLALPEFYVTLLNYVGLSALVALGLGLLWVAARALRAIPALQTANLVDRTHDLADRFATAQQFLSTDAHGPVEAQLTSQDAFAAPRGVPGVLRELAIMVAKDGEGLTKFVALKVTGAESAAAARRIGDCLDRRQRVAGAVA